MTPQAKLVLEHMRVTGSITNVEAHAVLRVRSVSRRITELLDAGFNIHKLRKTDSTGQLYVKYVLRPPRDVFVVNALGDCTPRSDIVDFAKTLFRNDARNRAAA